MSELSNIIPTRGSRQPITISVDEEGILVSSANDKRAVVVMYNAGPDTAWANKTLETASPDDGFPLPSGGTIVDGDSVDAWFLKTESGETADIRGWEVQQP